MTKYEELKKLQLQARKDRDEVKSSLYSYIISMLERKTKNPDDKLVFEEFKAYIKQVKPLVYSKEEDAVKRDLEIEILTALLPKQMTYDEILAVVNDLKANGVNEIKTIMPHFKKTYEGLYDANLVKQAIG